MNSSITTNGGGPTSSRIYVLPQDDIAQLLADFCLNNCVHAQGTPFSRRDVGEKEAASITSRFIDEINASHGYLKIKLEHHGDAIMSRWRKSSQEKRQALLEKHALGLANETWADMHFLRSTEVNSSIPEKDERRKRFLLPWLNLKLLSTDAPVLFALLHVRAAYDPQDWAAFDCSQLEYFWNHGLISLEFSPYGVAMNRPRYGSLVPFDFDAAERWEIVDFARGAVVLEAQAHLMNLLCKIVDAIVPGDGGNSVPRGCNTWNTKVTGGFRHTGKAELWSRFTNQPFSCPPRLDLDYIICITKARCEEMADHLHELQVCPAYLRHYIKEIYDTFQIKGKAAKYGVGIFLLERAFDYCEWLRLQEKCLRVKQTLHNSAVKLNSGQRLLEAQEQAFGSLEYFVEFRLNGLCTTLNVMTNTCAEFKHFFHQHLDPNHIYKPLCVLKCRLTEIYEKDPLACYLCCLGQVANKEGGQFDANNLFAALEHHFHANPTELKRISPLMMNTLSEIAAASEVMHYLSLHRSNWPLKVVVGDAADETKPAKAVRETNREDLQVIMELLRLDSKALVVNFYQRPAPSGPKNGARLKETRLQQRVIQQLWKRIYEWIGQACISSFSDDMKLRALSALSVSLTAEHAETIRKEEESFQQLEVSEPGTNALAALYQASSGNLKSTLEPTNISTKVKTRGASLNQPALTEQGVEKAEDGIPAVHISVPKHILDMFHLIFPQFPEERCRTVGWEEFVHAMNYAGCVASTCGGSAVRFELRDTNNGHGTTDSRAIIFHRLHPVPKIDPVMLRSGFGKRLTRRFGWTREHFVLAGEDDDRGKALDKTASTVSKGLGCV